jgi:dTDP-4-dehydrorhamnose 3,5-epimerase
MKLIETTISDVLILEPAVFSDTRGWFMETYSKEKLEALGIHTTFIQDNHSFSKNSGTLRGLHFQNDPKAQSKLVRCVRGAILDVAVDLRRGSPYYCQWVAVELSEENHRQLYIPKGFAHAFLTLQDHTEVVYKVDEYYAPEYDRSIRYDDPEFAIDWRGISPILSLKDANAPWLKDCDCSFSLANPTGGMK